MAKAKNITAVNVNANAGKGSIKEQCQELVNTFEKMIQDRDAKLEAAKEQLVENLNITSDKFRTVTGTMEAMRVIRMVFDGDPKDMEVYDVIGMAKGIALTMAVRAKEIADKALTLGYAEMDQLCDGFYDTDFANGESSAIDMVEELMAIDLCRNVGPASEDIVGFLDRVDIDIAETVAKLDELDPDWAEKYEPTEE